MNNPPAPTYFTDKHAVSMELRDYFAAKALQSMFANPDDSHENYDLSYDDYVKEIARCSYQMADAMLKAREA